MTSLAPLRVLQVSAFFAGHGGGIEVVAGQLARHLARRGVELVWMAGDGATERMQDDAPAGLRIDRATTVDFLERRLGLPAPIWSLGSLRRLWRHVGACDVVHVHDYLYFGSIAAMLFARLRGRPYVLTQHIGDIVFASRFARGLLRTLNRTLGRACLQGAAQAAFVGLPVLRCFDGFTRYRRPPVLISNGVDHAIYRPDPARARAANDTPVRVLFVGRFVEKKGLRLLRECVALPGVHWVFVGRGPESPQGWGVPPAVLSLLGTLPPEQVADEMRGADLLVLPSKGEGFPLVIQEALACGLPVLTSGEVADAFPRIDPACVWRVDLQPDDAHSAARLREALARLAADRKTLRAARANAAALAAQWSWDRCVDAYLAAYALALPMHAGAAAAGASKEDNSGT